MPADDLVLNVRQVAGYSPTANAPPASALLIQLGGLGGPYASISPQDLVGTALAQGGDMTVLGALSALSFSAGSGQFSNLATNVFSAAKACITNLAAGYGTLAGVPIATVNDVSAAFAAVVATFNGRTGNVSLWIDDILCAGGAPIFSPRFQGSPRACTPDPTSNSSRLATTAFVQGALSQLVLDYAPLDSPNFTGVPTAPTPALGSSDGQIATTAFVQNAVAESTTGVASFNTRTGAVVLTAADVTAAGGAPLASPTFTGTPLGPTAAPGTNTTQLATTAFVMAAVSGVVAGVSSFNTRTGAVTLTSTDITGAGGALTASTVASFNGRSGAVNLIANDISAASGALLASPAFTGAPTSTTPAPGDSSTRIATTAFVATMTGFAPINSPAFTGVPSAPTAAVGTNTTQLATTAFVLATVAAETAGVATFNGRSGAVTLLANDISSAGGALLASPALTGTPSAPTAAVGTNTTQLATTGFVMNAGFAPLAAPTFTGNAASTTPPAANNSTRIATTAFVATNFVPLTGATMSGGLTANGLASNAQLTVAGTAIVNGVLGGGQGSWIGNGASFDTNLSGFTVDSGTGSPAMQVMSEVNAAGTNGMLVRNDRTDGNAIVFFFGASTRVGAISQNGSTTTYGTTSDYRLKTVHGEAGPLVGAMIDAVPVYDASFAETAVRRAATPSVPASRLRYPMFLAHELQAQCPWAVVGEKDAVDADGAIDPQQVDASHLVAVLWAEVQNLRKRLDMLENAA